MNEGSGSSLVAAFDSLADRQVILFGGKGGVGKTTLSAAAALHFAAGRVPRSSSEFPGPPPPRNSEEPEELRGTRRVILFTTDPASNLHDLLGDEPSLRIEALDANALYARFLGANLESFLEIGDRGTYLDREELRRFFELSVPGVDELMAWMHIGELAEENPEALIVVDTAPTGHTLRMLSSSEHFRNLALALDAMQEKHRAMVRQFARREVRDAVDVFIEDFDARAARRRELLTDPRRTAFVPVTLAEPLVLEQTARLIEELHEFDVPFVVVNRSSSAPVTLAKPVVNAPRACVPLDSAERLREWSETPVSGAESEVDLRSAGLRPAGPPAFGRQSGEESPPERLPAESRRTGRSKTGAPLVGGTLAAVGGTLAPFLFLAGKGGVGKTSCSASIALQLAHQNPGKNYVVISVDPAHSLADLKLDPPPNLRVETVDTKAKWRRFRDSFGDKIEHAIDSLTPGNVSLGYDTEAMRRLIEMAPPGADELFAITRLHDLLTDPTLAGVVVDTAPTGHFLRLLDLPKTAGEWVREFMRILLRYRELISAGSFGEELVRASRELKEVDAALHSERAAVIVVTRPERIVVAETKRLLDDLRGRGIRVGGVIANYVTPADGDECDASMRSHELAALDSLGEEPVIIERRERPPMSAGELMSLVPL